MGCPTGLGEAGPAASPKERAEAGREAALTPAAPWRD